MQPNYILKANEAVLIRTDRGKGYNFLKKMVIGICAVILIGSIIFRESLLAELDSTSKVLLLGLIVGLFVNRGKLEDTPSPIELQFFDDYLILYRPKRYYNKKTTRMEYNKMLYSTITKCVYKSQSKRVHIYGDLIAKWYNYDSNGVVSPKPTYDRVVKETMVYFSCKCALEVDFVREIEEHSPLRVTIENT